MLKLKKSTNLNSTGEKIKIRKKNKNVLMKKSEVTEILSNDLKTELINEKKISKVVGSTKNIDSSEIKSVKSEKKNKAIPKPYRNYVEASTTSSRNKVAKKYKSPTLENVKPKTSKNKVKSKELHNGDGDKKPESIDSEKTASTKNPKSIDSAKRSNPNTSPKTKFGKKIHKKKIPKEGEMIPSLEEAPPFDEAHFNSIIKQDKIKRIVQVLNKLVKNETSKMKNSIFSDYRYNLNVACFKIPSVPKRIVKLKVKHSLADEDTLLIVKDLQRGLKADYEPTNQHYEDHLKENGVEGIKTVMSFNQLKTEYSTYEMKHKLSNLYDYYLCDGAIVGHVVGFLGKIFSSKSRCTPYAVRMGNPKIIKTEIKKALHKTSYKQGQKGNLISIPIGTHKMTPGQVSDNVIHIIGQLKTIYPGGFPNIRNMTLGINLKGTSSLPIYINMGKPLEGTPYIIGLREDKLSKLKEQANKILSQFELTNDASMVRLIKEENTTKRKRSNGLDDDDIEIESEKTENKTKKKIKTSENNVQKTREPKSNKNDNENESESSDSENASEESNVIKDSDEDEEGDLDESST